MSAHARQLGARAPGQVRPPHNVVIRRRSSRPARAASVSTIELGEIYRRYVADLVGYARRWGFTSEDAEDFTQDFFLQLERKHSLGAFDQTKGKFRSFLLTLFQRFLSNQWDSLHALRRGGNSTAVPLGAAGEADGGLVEWRTPERMAHVHWARLLLQHAFESLRKESERRGKARLFDLLLPHLLHQSTGASYARLARQVGLSNAATRMTVSRYRERLRLLICRELKGNGSGNGHAPDEIRDLFEVLGH